jgi:hypothetical protein
VVADGVGRAVTVGLEVGAEVLDGDGFGWTSGCFESSEIEIADTATKMRKTTSKPPPTITFCVEAPMHDGRFNIPGLESSSCGAHIHRLAGELCWVPVGRTKPPTEAAAVR